MAARHMAPGRAPRRRTLHIVPILICFCVLGILCAGGYLALRHFMTISVVVNGQAVKVHRGDTAQYLLDEGYANPKPGNLLAVDGSLLEEGKGERCTVTMNGNEVSISTPLMADSSVIIEDGGDKTEESTTKEETVPYKTEEGDRSFAGYYNGSIHLLSRGKDGTRVVRTGAVSGKEVEESVTKPIDAGYRIYTAKPVDRVVALTFDDGPWDTTTERILDLLEQYGAKATFFTIGNQVADHAKSVKRANEMGCQVCTHTWDHAAGSGKGVDLTKMSASEQVAEIEDGYKAIADVLGEEPAHIVRAPGGNFYGDIIDNVWDIVDAEIGWDVDTEDWRRPGSDAIAKALLSAEPGQVILMHDGGGDRSQTVEALREALPTMVDRGYKFVTIDELLAYGVS